MGAYELGVEVETGAPGRRSDPAVNTRSRVGKAIRNASRNPDNGWPGRVP